MARYTYTLREVVATFGKEEVKEWFKDYNLEDYLSTEEMNVINARGTWNADRLADRIITHYTNREIGCEGIGEFMLNIKDMMNEIMETYAPVIYSASLSYNPLENVNVTETYDRESNSNSVTNSNTKTNASGLEVSSDTPQGQISKSAILAGNYATSTSANETDNNVVDNTSNTGDGKEHSTRTTKGNSGSRTMQELVEAYRKTIRPIETEIVYALEPLFMSIK